ncbi:MAG: response regulator [Pseudomonadota bacterium]
MDSLELKTVAESQRAPRFTAADTLPQQDASPAPATQVPREDVKAMEDQQPAQPSLDWLQLGFWGLILVAVAAASVAVAWPGAGGPTAIVTLIAMAAGGLVALLWLARGAGRRIGLFPERGAAAAAIAANAPRFGWIEALDEAVLVTEAGGAPIAANTAYQDLARQILIAPSGSSGPDTVDYMLGANPGLSAPIFRLSRSAKALEHRREVLPPVTIGPEAWPAQFEITVSPLPRGKVLWRLRRIQGSEEATGAADMKSLYVEDAPMGFFAARPDGTITYANGWLRELLGIPESAKNIRIDDIMRPEFVKLLRRDRKSGAPGRADIMVRGNDGVEVPVQAVTTWSGKGIEATGRTIIMSASQAAKGEDRLTAVSASRPPRPDGDPMFDDAPFGAVRLEGGAVDGAIITDANRALMAMTEGQAAPGGRFADLFTSEDGLDALSLSLIDAIDKPVGLVLAGDDARHVNVFVTLDAQGRPSVAYVIDITEQKQLEMRLAQGEKMQAVGQLAGGVAHDFNNVLQGIVLNTDRLMTLHPLGDPSYENLKSIYEFSMRAKELVRMLLAYARQQTFKSEVLNVTDFFSEFSILLRQILDERVELDMKHGRDLPRIKADRNQLETAILNLVTNARDAMLAKGQGRGQLTIRTGCATAEDAHKHGFGFVDQGDYLLIEVEDNGHGMTKAVMEKIFQPFFTTKDAGAGTGLGLASVYGIVKQSGGYVCPISEVGKGTTFQIYLPALTAAEVAAAEAETQPEAADSPNHSDYSGRGRILLIEDEDGVRGIAASLLESRGYEVEQACDGEDAMALLEEDTGEFDLVISDVVMPGMDGPTLIREARERLGDARVIFMSGYAERDIAKQLDDDHEVSFIPKPFTVRELADRVKHELGLKKEKDREAA